MGVGLGGSRQAAAPTQAQSEPALTPVPLALPAVSLDSVLQDVRSLQQGMELTRKEFMRQDDSPVLKDFLKVNLEVMEKLQADSKTAKVGAVGLWGRIGPPHSYVGSPWGALCSDLCPMGEGPGWDVTPAGEVGAGGDAEGDGEIGERLEGGGGRWSAAARPQPPGSGCLCPQEAYESAVEYFGENPKTSPPTTFFPMFMRFIRAYKVGGDGGCPVSGGWEGIWGWWVSDPTLG